jgi:hypothetical protein
MRIPILAALVAFTGAARADVTFQTHEEFGVDFAMLHAPRTAGGETDAGAVLHYASTTSRSPSWLMFGIQAGLFAGSADRILAPLLFNLRIGEREGPFARLDAGWIVTTPVGEEDDDNTWSHAFGATVGWKLGPWQLAAGAMKSGAFTGPVYMFTLGRDVVYLDSVVTRSTP